MENLKISENIKYIGVDDLDLDLFESQYDVPNGMCYNSYVILDEKVAVMDTVDLRKSEKWLENLENELKGRTPDYLVCQHIEPDHSGSIKQLCEKYPSMKIVGNAKTFVFINQFFDINLDEKTVVVKEGDVLNLGKAELQFILAPMVHWPEVMVAYEKNDKVLFSADAFGKFGAINADEAWTCEARRYYFNIVGKYGAQVQSLLKKIAGFKINTICPLHGPILKEDLEYYINKYQVWSSFEAEDEGIFIAFASIHGNTKVVAEKFKEILLEMGAPKVAIADLARDDLAEALEDAFRHDRLVLASSSYDGGVFPCMDDFLHHLKSKNFQKRKVGLIENFSWAPSANKTMKSALELMKNIEICENAVSIKSTLKESDLESLTNLAKELLNK